VARETSRIAPQGCRSLPSLHPSLGHESPPATRIGPWTGREGAGGTWGVLSPGDRWGYSEQSASALTRSVQSTLPPARQGMLAHRGCQGHHGSCVSSPSVLPGFPRGNRCRVSAFEHCLLSSSAPGRCHTQTSAVRNKNVTGSLRHLYDFSRPICHTPQRRAGAHCDHGTHEVPLSECLSLPHAAESAMAPPTGRKRLPQQPCGP